jgi:purine-nucleoside phosphorylase
MQADVAQQFNETLQFLTKGAGEQPTVGIVLGTGMGGLADAIEVERQIPYNFIPHFPLSTVESHFGKLLFGKIGSSKGKVNVVAMQGRLHYYEGYSMFQITYPIRIMKMLGVHTLFLSNAAGAVNLNFKKGDLVALDDHINLLPENPLRGPNLDEFGPRFIDMSSPYDPALIARAEAIAKTEGYALRKGVYAAVQGPNLETRAEYRYLRTIGADLVGMSTVPEVIVANHMGVKAFAVSVVTDECDPDNLKPVAVEEIIAVAKAAEPKLSQLLTRLIGETHP